MSSTSQTIAVITGDIVKSQSLSRDELEAVFDGLSDAAARMERLSGQPAYLTRFRGDGWQMVVTPQYLLRAILSVRSRILMVDKHFDTRMAVAIGEGSVASNTLDDATGPVFTASGHALEAMTRNQRIHAAEVPVAIAMAIPLLASLSNRWSRAQSEVIWHAMDIPTPSQVEVARRFDHAPQTVHKHWTNAEADVLLQTCLLWEANADV